MNDTERATSPVDSLIDNEFPSPRKESHYLPSDSFERGTRIVFYQINYGISVSKGCCKKAEKNILLDCSGIMKPGLNAILGPTGSGKTTLLDILAGRKDKSCINGYVLVNEELQPDNFQLMSGFVSQDDVVMGTLTVRENLNFSASLRLPGNFSSADREKRVDNIIEDLGLSSCSETKVGSDEFRGISGGERKRTNIGMELIINPQVLFLDEPTTGLDASTAYNVMELLQQQGKKGRTIIFSIHQPRYTIFKFFDDITLLSCGRVVYKGPAQDSLQYFESLGHLCEQYNNPADFFLDVIVEEEKQNRLCKALTSVAVLGKDGSEVNIDEGQLTLREHYELSRYYNETMEEVQTAVNVMHRTTPSHMFNTTRKADYARTLLPQISIVCKRTLLNLLRDPRSLTTQITVNLIYALVIGAIYWNVGNDSAGLQNRVGVFFFMITNMVFSNMSAVALFIKERRIFRHESANGYYRVSAFFLAKVLCDIIPMRVIPILIFSAISYFMIGLVHTVEKFFIYTLTLLLTSFAAAGICILVSSSVELIAVANLLVSLPFVFMMIFSGLLVNLKRIPSWLRWIEYLSVFRYGLSNLEINELNGMVFQCEANTTCLSGDEYLVQNGVHVDQLWYNELALGIIFVGLMIFSYIQLRRMKKYQ